MHIRKNREQKKDIKNTHVKNWRGPQHKDLRAPTLYVGGGPLTLYFPGKEPPHKEFLGWDPNWGIWGVFLYVYVLFSLLKEVQMSEQVLEFPASVWDIPHPSLRNPRNQKTAKF